MISTHSGALVYKILRWLLYLITYTDVYLDKNKKGRSKLRPYLSTLSKVITKWYYSTFLPFLSSLTRAFSLPFLTDRS